MHSFIRSPILLTVEPRYRQYVEKGWSTEPLSLMGVEPGGSELGGVLGEGGDSGRLSIMLTIILIRVFTVTPSLKERRPVGLDRGHVSTAE